METLLQNVGYAPRQLRRSPGFTVTSLLTLALGIGGTTASFTLTHAVLLQSLPVKHPVQLYRVGDNTFGGLTGGLEDNFGTFSYDLYRHFRDNTAGFQELAAFQSESRRVAVRRTGNAEAVQSSFGEFVSGNYFSMLGVDAAIGRTLSASDDQAGGGPVAVISYPAWKQRFALDPSVVGSSVEINGHVVLIVGVASPGFFGAVLRPNPPEFWLPLATERVMNGAASILDQPSMHWLYVMGRVRDDVKPSEIDARLKVELQQWLQHHASLLSAEERPRLPRQTVRLVPAAGGIVSVQAIRNVYGDGLRLLMVISGFVLLIVCANVASLVLVRAVEGRREVAIRVALGAARRRIMAHALTGNVILAITGGALGLALSYAAIPLLLRLAFAGANYVPISTQPSAAVLLFALGISMASGVLFGVGPAWMASRTDPAAALRGSGRTMSASGHHSLRLLVVIQAALSLALLMASGLLIESLRNLQNQNFGFEARNRVVTRIEPSLAGYKPEQLAALHRSIHDNLMKIPGVLDVSFACYAPLSGSMWSSGIVIPGRILTFASPSDWVTWDRAGANYFETIGTRILRGRGITEQDTPITQRVAVVNQAFVRRFFTGEDPIGKHFGKAGVNSYEIVGVVEDTKYFHPEEATRPMFILPLTQSVHYDDADDNEFERRSLYASDVILNVNGMGQTIEPLIRRAFLKIDPNLTVIRVSSLSDQVSRQLSQQILLARLTSLFGFIAVTLAAIGLYGITSYAVERGKREIGIRIALGADRNAVILFILKGAFTLVGIGLILGIPLTIAINHILGNKLYGVSEYDPRVLSAAVAGLWGFAFVASWLPARRAASVAPIGALRGE